LSRPRLQQGIDTRGQRLPRQHRHTVVDIYLATVANNAGSSEVRSGGQENLAEFLPMRLEHLSVSGKLLSLIENVSFVHGSHPRLRWRRYDSYTLPPGGWI